MTDREKLIELLVEAETGTTCLSGLSKEDQIRQIMEQIADRLIANGVTVQEWIPVTERLPDRNDVVIAFYPTMRGTSAEMQLHKAQAATPVPIGCRCLSRRRRDDYGEISWHKIRQLQRLREQMHPCRKKPNFCLPQRRFL